MQLDSVVIVGGARTAIGAFGGALSSFAPHELGTYGHRSAAPSRGGRQ